uniref:Uncharacterized protein n=1 Tax=Ciona savignyi TaxID=51511 RepID=H2Z1F9_CIOSA
MMSNDIVMADVSDSETNEKISKPNPSISLNPGEDALKVEPMEENVQNKENDAIQPKKRRRKATKKTLDSYSDDDDDFVPDKKQKSDEESDFEVDSETNSQATRPSQLKRATSKKVVKKVQKPKPNNPNNGRCINEWIEVYVPKVS